MLIQIILYMPKVSSGFLLSIYFVVSDDFVSSQGKTWTRGYKTFFMLNSAEPEIFSTNKYENANNSWHFHIY